MCKCIKKEDLYKDKAEYYESRLKMIISGLGLKENILDLEEDELKEVIKDIKRKYKNRVYV